MKENTKTKCKAYRNVFFYIVLFQKFFLFSLIYIYVYIFLFWFQTLLSLDLDSEIYPRGLHSSDINRLPTRKYVHPNSSSACSSNSEVTHKRTELNKECQVCLTDYENGDVLRILPCFHEFHTPCIDPWLLVNNFLIYDFCKFKMDCVE